MEDPIPKRPDWIPSSWLLSGIYRKWSSKKMPLHVYFDLYLWVVIKISVILWLTISVEVAPVDISISRSLRHWLTVEIIWWVKIIWLEIPGTGPGPRSGSGSWSTGLSFRFLLKILSHTYFCYFQFVVYNTYKKAVILLCILSK